MMATINKYLIISIIILAVGLPAAYAITITLGGDPVIINGILDLMGNRITNVGTPTTSTDAATKAYVDSASGTDTLALLGCTDNQIAEFVGSVWTCVVNVDTDTVPWNSRIPQSTLLTTVDNAADVGYFTSITIGTDGLPIISYFDNSLGDLIVVHCTNASCSTFDTPTILDFPDTVGGFTSITIGTDGFPIISYYDDTLNGLKAVHCLNVSCIGGVGVGFETPTTLDTGGNDGWYTSITIGTDGFPVISYYDITNANLKVAHCENASCSSGSPTITTVDSSVDVGLYTSIAIGTDGLPVISYRDVGNQNLKVAHCENASCNSGSPTITTVDSGTNVGLFTSITIGTDDLPVISYSGGSLNVAHCENASCSSGSPTITIVDSAVAVGLFTSITIGTDGLPIISYWDGLNENLKVAKCSNASCSSSNTITTVDSTSAVGTYTSITIGTDGLPIISYFDDTTDDLRVAKCTNPYCLNNWIRR